MNREELKKILPHREPMLLLDEAQLLEDGSALAKLKVTGEEFFFQGHFPGNPILPGVIQCEIMAQSCAVLLLQGDEGIDPSLTPVYTSIKDCKFRGMVRPSDELIIKSQLTKVRPPFYVASSSIEVEGKVVSQATLSFALVKADV